MFDLFGVSEPRVTAPTRSLVAKNYDTAGNLMAVTWYYFRPAERGYKQVITRHGYGILKGKWVDLGTMPLALDTDGKPEPQTMEAAAQQYRTIKAPASEIDQNSIFAEIEDHPIFLTEQNGQVPDLIAEALHPVFAVPLLETELSRQGFVIEDDGVLRTLDALGQPTGARSTPLEQVVAARRVKGTRLPAPVTTVAVKAVALPGPRREPILSGRMGAILKTVTLPVILLLRGAIKDVFSGLAETMYQALPDYARADPSLLLRAFPEKPYVSAEPLLRLIENDSNALETVLASADIFLGGIKNNNAKKLWKVLRSSDIAEADKVRCAFFLLNCEGEQEAYYYANTILCEGHQAYLTQDWPRLNSLMTVGDTAGQIAANGLLVNYYKKFKHGPVQELYYSAIQPLTGFGSSEAPPREGIESFFRQIGLAGAFYYRDSDYTQKLNKAVERLLNENHHFLIRTKKDTGSSYDKFSKDSGLESQSLSGTWDYSECSGCLKNGWSLDYNRTIKWHPAEALFTTHPHLFSDLDNRPMRPQLQLVSSTNKNDIFSRGQRG